MLNNISFTDLKPTWLRTNPYYVRIYILWMNLFFHIVCPFLVLILMNFKIYQRIKDFEARKAIFFISRWQNLSVMETMKHKGGNYYYYYFFCVIPSSECSVNMTMPWSCLVLEVERTFNAYF